MPTEVTRLVMGSNERWPVGEHVVITAWDAFGERHDRVPVVVLRESTERAWRDYNASMGVHNPRKGYGEATYYYEVATD